MFYAILAILSFGFLIASHEAGHMFAAKAFGVKVNEYAIGMGPALFSKQKGETKYSLRLFPIGGYCAIEGETGNSNDPRALCSQAVWKQIVVFAAGVTVNFLTGFLILLITYMTAAAIVTPDIAYLDPAFPYQGESGLKIGDTIRSINGRKVLLHSDVALLLMIEGDTDDGAVTFGIERDGELLNREIKKTTYVREDGSEYKAYGISYGGTIPATLGSKLKYTWLNTVDLVRIIWLNLEVIVTGKVSTDDVMGPIGIVSEMTQLGQESEATNGVSGAISDVMYFVALIAVNLAVVNLLPIPALDGGHIVILLLDALFLKLFHKKMSLKVVNAVSLASFVVVLALMAVISWHDIARLVAS